MKTDYLRFRRNSNEFQNKRFDWDTDAHAIILESPIIIESDRGKWKIKEIIKIQTKYIHIGWNKSIAKYNFEIIVSDDKDKDELIIKEIENNDYHNVLFNLRKLIETTPLFEFKDWEEYCQSLDYIKDDENRIVMK